MSDPTAIGVVERPVICPVCRRHLNQAMMPKWLEPGTVKIKTRCHSCKAWRWCDVAVGAIREG